MTALSTTYPAPSAGPAARPIPGIAIRALRAPDDYAGMASVFNRAMAADGIDRATTEQELSVFHAHLENCDPARDLVVVATEAEVIGYLRTEWREEPLNQLRLYMHRSVLLPEWRGRGLGTELLARAEARLGDLASGHPPHLGKWFQAVVSERQTAAAVLLDRHGYQPVRYEYSMLRPDLEDIPDLALPDGLEVRPALAADYRRIWEANNEGFRDHWGYIPMGENDYQRWMSQANFDPSLWRVAWDGDQVAGMVLSFVNATENAAYNRQRGYTEDICVRRPWRRRGLARALLARSLRALRARGMAEAGLGVDTENTSGALRLYESLGFRPVHRWIVLRKPLGGAAPAG